MSLWSFAPFLANRVAFVFVLVFGILGIGTKLCEAMVIPLHWGYCIVFLYFNHAPIGDASAVLCAAGGARLRISTPSLLWWRLAAPVCSVRLQIYHSFYTTLAWCLVYTYGDFLIIL